MGKAIQMLRVVAGFLAVPHVAPIVSVLAYYVLGAKADVGLSGGSLLVIGTVSLVVTIIYGIPGYFFLRFKTGTTACCYDHTKKYITYKSKTINRF